MGYKSVAYYGSWSVYRKGQGKCAIENIDPHKATHLIYSFAKLGPDGSVHAFDDWNDIQQKGFLRFNNLKQNNPRLKTLIAIGGWEAGSATFSQVAASPSLRQTFAQSALQFMVKYGFDGFDLDWEYPCDRGGSPADKQNVTLMLQALRGAFGNKFLLTAAVPAGGHKVDQSYDVPRISQYLDFINLMTYDFNGAFDGKTGQNAPLYASSLDHNRENNVDAALRGWLARGAPAHKLVLGMPAYGRSFTVNSTTMGLNQPASAGNPGPLIGEAGMLGYNEIRLLKSGGGWTEGWDDEQKVPFMYRGNQWVGFDDEKSIRMKAEYAKAMNLGGAMVWSLESDDFGGYFGRPYPILSTINETLFGSSHAR